MEKLIKTIKERSWYKQAGNVKAYYIITCCRAAMHCLKGRLGFWSIANKSYIEAFLPYDNFIQLAKKNLDMQKKNPSHIHSIVDECGIRSRKLSSFYRKLDGISSMSLKEIQKSLKTLDKLNYDYWCCSYFCDLYDPEGDDMLGDELRSENIDLNDVELNTMMRSNWRNYVQEERLDLLRIMQQKKTPKFRKLLRKHALKNFYVDNSWENTKVLTEKDFLKKMDEVEDPEEEIKGLTQDWEQEHENLRKKHGISNNLMNVLYYFRHLFIIRDKRKQHTLLSNHYYDALFYRLAQLISLRFEDMGVITVDEVSKKFSPKTIRDKINERKSLLIEIYPDKKILAGSKALKIYNALQKSYGLVENLKGKSAARGKTTGIVRVIMGEAHFSKFNEGEIIVAPMTRPEYVPLMRKAVAVITDEGGITCHAAIVSRELGIPCIVGTQKATSKLRDGMLVEVDADKGIIKVTRRLKLLTVQSLVEQELEKQPKIIAVLQEGLLNITAAAEKFKPEIERQTGKKVDLHAVSMAIRRYSEKRFKSV
jgi:phosphohistidine swiveling domain-containing protein